jgi:chemotaxis protein methyltransferase CheR
LNTNYQYFIEEFKKKTKIDISKYKDEQMVRRLENFIRNKGLKDFIELTNGFKKDHQLVVELKDYITINVTEFLRNEKMWDVFYKIAIPEITKNKRKIKLWSAACSSGEEPYTIAILLKEHFPTLDFEIIATDIDEVILEKAKNGVYKKDDVKSFDSKLLKKYFNELDFATIQIKNEIKQKVKFERHNLLADPYPKFIDIIVCRNVLIYFKDDAKEEVYKKFSSSLNDEGILFIGATEQIFKPEQFNFKILKSFFYQKKI